VLLLFADSPRGEGRDEAIVRRMATRFAEAWNKHDMTELASLFAEDADFVNVAGEDS